MTTIRELVDDISRRLHAFTGLQEQYTYLTSPITETDTTLNIAHTGRIIEGLIEVDDELVLVDQVQDATVQLFPFGRAQNGTTAAAHEVNARIVNDPQFPRNDLLKAVKETVDSIHPMLFRVKSTELTWNPAVFSYEIPADVDRVLEVKYAIPGPSNVWPIARNWAYNPAADTGVFPTGKSLDIYEGITPGYKVRVTYAGPFGSVTSYTETLAELGIPETVSDVVIFGSCWRIVQMLESSRLQMESVEQYARQGAVPPGAITNFGRQLFAAFQQRLTEERKRLLTLTPKTIHYTR